MSAIVVRYRRSLYALLISASVEFESVEGSKEEEPEEEVTIGDGVPIDTTAVGGTVAELKSGSRTNIRETPPNGFAQDFVIYF